MYSLLHGDVAGSLALNPLVVAGYLALVLLVAGITLERAPQTMASRTLYWAAGSVAVLAMVWSAIVRNIIS